MNHLRRAVDNDLHWLGVEIGGIAALIWGVWQFLPAVAAIVGGLLAMLVAEIRTGNPGDT